MYRKKQYIQGSILSQFWASIGGFETYSLRKRGNYYKGKGLQDFIGRGKQETRKKYLEVDWLGFHIFRKIKEQGNKYRVQS